MITMKEFMELVDYKITEGSEYGWRCYGPNAYCLDSWNGVHGKGGYSFSIVFSTKTQKVYEVSVCDYTNDRAYRMINPKNVDKHRKEAKSRGEFANMAWDAVDYVDLEVDDDFFQKALAIKAGEDYSTDITVPLDLPDELILQAALAAHKQNITLNEYINLALANLVDSYNRGDISPEQVKDWVKEQYGQDSTTFWR
jgi:hypothetical protein